LFVFFKIVHQYGLWFMVYGLWWTKTITITINYLP